MNLLECDKPLLKQAQNSSIEQHILDTNAGKQLS